MLWLMGCTNYLCPSDVVGEVELEIKVQAAIRYSGAQASSISPAIDGQRQALNRLATLSRHHCTA